MPKRAVCLTAIMLCVAATSARAELIKWPGNGHCYEFRFRPEGIDWQTAENESVVDCDGWSYDSKEFDSENAGDGIPTSTNLVGAESIGGTLVFTVDTPTELTPSAGSPDIYLPGEIVTWDGFTYDRVFAPGTDPFLAAYSPSTVINALATAASAAAAAPAGSDVILFSDPEFDRLHLAVVTDVSAGTATSKVTAPWPPPWLNISQVQLAGPVAVDPDSSTAGLGRVNIMLDVPGEVQCHCNRACASTFPFSCCQCSPKEVL